MKLRDKPRLRSLMTKLRALPIDPADAYVVGAVAQERLDFVAMAAGLKPVYVTGRGFDHPAWTAGVRAAARDAGFHVVTGPSWQAVPPPADLPDWFTAPAQAALAAAETVYVTRARHLARTLAELAAGRRPGVAEEATLLGFPECCVAAHYANAEAFERAVFEMLRRRAGGDEAAVRRIVESGAPIAPETEEERAALAALALLAPAPWTSLNLCASCAADPDGPGLRLSRTYAEFAAALAEADRGLRSDRRAPERRRVGARARPRPGPSADGARSRE